MEERGFQIEKGHDTVTKSFRIPVPLAERLEKLAAENHISVNSLVVQCIRYSLEHLKL